MSQKEFQRVKVIENAVGGRLSVSEAAALLQLSERQVQRLSGRWTVYIPPFAMRLRRMGHPHLWHPNLWRPDLWLAG